MSAFLTELSARLIDEDTHWVLEKPLWYSSSLLKCQVKVPAGFKTDFASIPRIPIIFDILGDTAHREGVLHDYLFKVDSDPVVGWRIANRVLYEAMRARKKPSWKCYAVFVGVMIGSYPFYHKSKVF